MKIYSISNMICFLIQLGVFIGIQFGAAEQVIKIWHWESIQHEMNFTSSTDPNSYSQNYQKEGQELLSLSKAESLSPDERADLRAKSDDFLEADFFTKTYAYGAVEPNQKHLPLVPL